MTMQHAAGAPIFCNQAVVLQWVIHELLSLQPKTLSDPKQLGRHMVINTLLPFATELALKGLSAKEYPGKKPRRIHNLAILYAELPSRVRKQADTRFMRYQRSEPDQASLPTSLANFLALHRDDFEHWRYLNAPSATPIPEQQNFQYALSALLDVCLLPEDAPLRTGGSLPA